MTGSVNATRRVVLGLLAVLSIITASVAAPTVWVVDGMQRVKPDAAAGSAASIELFAGRGEYEPFQVIVRAAGAALTNVNVTVSDLTGPGTIPRHNLALYREHYVSITRNSPKWGGYINVPQPVGWYPDGLIPFVNPETGAPLSGATLQAVPFSLAQNANQPIWIDVFVPRSTSPGHYTGTVTVTSDQGSTTAGLGLTVWSFTLPLKPTLKSSFDDWGSKSKPRMKELLRHRLMPLSVNAADERELIDSLGLTSYGRFFWSGADISTCSMSAAPSVSAIQTKKAAQQQDLFFYNYSADEIDACPQLYTPLKEWARNLHSAGVDNLVTMTPVTELYDDGSGTGRSAVDIWVMLPNMYDGAVSRVNYVIGKGDEAWSYNCLVQDGYSPKWQIDFTPLDFRIQPGFISQSLNLTGLLYWRIDLATSDPWNNVQTYAEGTNVYNGDGMLLYPGDQVGLPGSLVASMRLKWLREGVEDFEYVALLKRAGEATQALAIAARVGKDWHTWTHNTDSLYAARRQIGEELDRLGRTGTSAPEAKPGARTGSGPAVGLQRTNFSPSGRRVEIRRAGLAFALNGTRQHARMVSNR